MRTVAFKFVVVLAAASAAFGQLRFREEEKETIRRNLEFSAGSGTKVLVVDNINGSIRVTGYDGKTIEVTADKTIRAESQDKIQTAKQEVKLEITDTADTVRLFVDDGDRCTCRDDWNNRRNSQYSWNDPGYYVAFDFDIRVPSQATVRVRTVNSGDIEVKNVAGDFDVENINGGIQLLDMSGSGKAHALNRPLNVTFKSNPKRDSYFGSLNGKIDVTFQPDLSADLRYKTFNGRIYTDFDVTNLPSVPTTERRNGMFVYRSGFSGARVGKGGPEITFDGFNGNVRILKAK